MKKIIATIIAIALLVALVVGIPKIKEYKEWQEYLEYEKQLYEDIDAGLYGSYDHILQEWGETYGK